MQDNGSKQAEVRTEFSPVIGAALPRVDGPVKTTGRAQYAADYSFPGMVYAVPVVSTIANGKIRSMDTAAAEKMPGVLAVLHHDNIGPLFHISPGSHAGLGEQRQPFEDEIVSYWGQYVALAVAKTLQQAQAAAAAVRVKLRRGEAESLGEAGRCRRDDDDDEPARRCECRVCERAGEVG